MFTTAAHSATAGVDLTVMMGYPLRIHVNSASAGEPLFWESWSHDKCLVSSTFLQSPGLPLNVLLSESERALIPSQAWALACAVPSKQYQLLQTMSLSKQALELAISNPLLFVLLVDYAEQHDFDVAYFQKVVLAKRTSILSQMGLVDSLSAVRILARTPLHLKHYANLQAVISVLEDKGLVAHLCHVQQPTIAAFLLLCRRPQLLWPSLLDMLQAESSLAQATLLYNLVRDCHALGADLKQLQRLKNQVQLRALHDRLVQRYNAHNNIERAAHYLSVYGEYPLPPIAGTEQIQPLTSWEELLIEGQAMNHCAASFHKRIYAGSSFIYKVLGEKRLTLSLAKTRRGWVLEELSGYANGAPSAQDQELVHSWLLSHAGGRQ